jgi:hypothetical protein
MTNMPPGDLDGSVATRLRFRLLASRPNPSIRCRHELGTPACSFSITWSRLKLAGACRAGNSASDEIMLAT